MIARRPLLGALLAVGACTAPSPDEIGSAVPAPDAFLAAIRPAELGREADAVQLVTVTRGDKAISVELRVSVTAGGLTLVAQDMLGQRLMTVRWDDTGVRVERSANLPDTVSPTGLLADLVAICWPAPTVRRALEKSGASLIENEGLRIVASARRETLRVTIGWPQARWTGRMSYRNLRAGYTVDVQSVEQS